MKKTILAACALLLALLAAGAVACEHSYTGWVTKTSATCTRQGHQFKYCRKCDHWEQRYTPKLPHTPDEWVVNKEPTCTDKGVMGAHCTVCGGYLRQEIDKLGHEWETTEVTSEPTCKKTGKGVQVCSRCGKSRKGELPKLPHEWGEWETVREPSGKKKGLRERVCLSCGAKDQENFYVEGWLYEVMPSSPEVVRLQTMLKDLGFYSGSIGSGTFGSLTGKAVYEFQRKNKIRATEVADEATLALIREKWEKKTGRSADELLPAQEAGDGEEADDGTKRE